MNFRFAAFVPQEMSGGCLQVHLGIGIWLGTKDTGFIDFSVIESYDVTDRTATDFLTGG